MLEIIKITATCSAVLALAATALGAQYDVSWHTFDTGGAARTAGGPFTVSGSVGQPDATRPMAGGPFQVSGGFWTAADGCESAADCADRDGNGIRDDGCTWWQCDAGFCSALAIAHADLGGAFGACPPDGTTDANDHFHALNCFSNRNTTDDGPYPCESNTPSAMNIDAGGVGAPCHPDGMCDGHDAFAAIDAFAGVSPCGCGAPAPTTLPTPPPGPPTIVAEAGLRLRPEARMMTPGSTMHVEVWIHGELGDLRGYQLHHTVTGGVSGALQLVDMFIEECDEHVFDGVPAWHAFNLATKQLLAGIDQHGVATADRAYLATLVFEASDDADGRFKIRLLHDLDDPHQRTFLMPTDPRTAIAVDSAPPVMIRVRDRRQHPNTSTSAQD